MDLVDKCFDSHLFQKLLPGQCNYDVFSAGKLTYTMCVVLSALSFLVCVFVRARVSADKKHKTQNKKNKKLNTDSV